MGLYTNTGPLPTALLTSCPPALLPSWRRSCGSCTRFAMGTFIGLTIYVSSFLEGVLGLSVGQSGVALVPLRVGTVTGATRSSRSMRRGFSYP